MIGSMPPAAHTAVFVVRAWTEDGEFRARVSYSTDPQSGVMRLVTPDPEDVVSCLTAMLQNMIGSAKS